MPLQRLPRYRALDLVFDLRAPAVLADPLRAALVDIETTDAPSDRLTVRRTRRSGWTCRWNDDDGARPSGDEHVFDDGEALRDVLDTISASAARSASDRHAILHCGAISIDDAGIVFMGSTDSGTSALVAAAVLDGHRYLADDVTAIDESGGIRAFRRPIGLRTAAARELGLDVPAGPFSPTYPFRVDADSMSRDRTNLHAVFLVHGGEADMSGRLDPADALVEMYRHSVGAVGSERAMFARLEQIAKSVPVHLLGWQNPQSGIEQVRRALR